MKTAMNNWKEICSVVLVFFVLISWTYYSGRVNGALSELDKNRVLAIKTTSIASELAVDNQAHIKDQKADLFGLITKTTKKYDLDNQVDQIRPNGQGGFVVGIKSTNFADTVGLVSEIESEGVSLRKVEINRSFDKSGVDVVIEVIDGDR